MKILFIADIHIKLKTKGIPDTWAVNRFNILQKEVNKVIYSHGVDTVIIGGDAFDRMPTLEELAIFISWMESFEIPVYIIPGNHEAVKKDTTFLTVIAKLIKNPKVKIIDEFFSLENIDFIPYNRLKQYHPSDTDFHGNILVTHVRGEIPPHVKPEVPLELFSRWDIVFAGDLHSYENSQLNIVYPGSPTTTSFHRNLVSTGVVVFDSETPKDYEWVELNVPQLIRKTVKAGEDMPATTFHHTVYEVEGDIQELSKINNTELLDKKVVKRNSEATLILDPKLTIVEELSEYLRYILELPDNTVDEVVGLFNDNINKINME